MGTRVSILSFPWQRRESRIALGRGQSWISHKKSHRNLIAGSYPHLYYRAAAFVDKIFRGAKPGDLPVEQPMRFELVINLKTAKQIGVTLSPNVVARADSVIK
jgi:hypothetical protein